MLLKQGTSSDRLAVISNLGNAIEAFESVPTAIYAFLRHRESFRDVVTYAISLGGDADTIGSMAGAIVGAYHGIQGIPEEWCSIVEGVDQMRELASALLKGNANL